MAGAVTVTASLMLAVYAIVNGNEEGWTSLQTLGLLGVAAGADRPVPRDRVACGLAADAARHLPEPERLDRERRRRPHGRGHVRVLLHLGALPPGGARYTPLEVGLAYLPSMVIWGGSSLFLSDRLVMRFGIKPPLIAGSG